MLLNLTVRTSSPIIIMAAVPSTISIPQFKFITNRHPNFDKSAKSQSKNFVSIPHAASPSSSSSSSSLLSDPFVLQLAETLEDSLSSTVPSLSPLQKVRDNSSESLLSASWPSRKDESFRFTDTSFIRDSQIHPISLNPIIPPVFIKTDLEDESPNLAVLIDGHFVNSLSSLSGLNDNKENGVFFGSLSSLTDDKIMKRIFDSVSGSEGDLFCSLNGVGSPDLMVVYVPNGCKVEGIVHLRYYSVESSDKGTNVLPISNPRVAVVVEDGGEISIVEEYMSGGDEKGCYWANSVIEVVIGEGAKVNHCYMQIQSMGAAHTKWTSVRQESKSLYELVEIGTGGRLSRHNLHVQQKGPDTKTELSTLHLSVGDQIQDLHSKIVMDHPRGYSRQLHKCIVAHSFGQAIFDGNVQVNRYAQQTDAGQLTRSLLLEPRATVNVKPNLQIIADDVKCSHGAAISDLEENQLFYFQARGIDAEMARKALIFSFAAEVIEKIPYPSIKKKVTNHIKEVLEPTIRGSAR